MARGSTSRNASHAKQAKQCTTPRTTSPHHPPHATPLHSSSLSGANCSKHGRGEQAMQCGSCKGAELCKAKRIKQRKCSRCNRQSKQVLHAARLHCTTLNLVSTRVRGVTLYGMYDLKFAVRFVAFFSGLLVCNLQHALSKPRKRSRRNLVAR